MKNKKYTNKQKTNWINLSFFQNEKEEPIREINSRPIGPIEIEINNPAKIKKELLQIQILREFQQQIDQNIFEMKSLRYELSEIETQQKEITETEELERLIRKFQEIKEKVDEIKSNYDVLKNRDLINEISRLIEDQHIKDLVEEYKENSQNKQELVDLKNEIDRRVEYLSEIEQLDVKKDTLEHDIENKNEELTGKENKLEEHNQNLNAKETELENIKVTASTYDDMIGSFEQKVKNIAPERQVTARMGLISSMLGVTLIATAVKHLKKANNPVKLASNAILFGIGVHGVRKALKPEVTYKPSANYEGEFTKMIDDIDYLYKHISQSVNDIEYLKTSFKETFDKYVNTPVYMEALAKIQKMETEMKQQKIKIKNQLGKTQTIKNTNYVKIKTINEMNRNN